MTHTLAAADVLSSNVQSLYQTTVDLFSKIDLLNHWQHIQDTIGGGALHQVWAVVLLVFGLLSMLSGYRWRKIYVVAMSVVLGSFAGYLVGGQFGSPMLMALCFGALTGLLSWPMMKYAGAILGGLLGAFLGANIWAAIASLIPSTTPMPEHSVWIGAVIGLIFMGLLAFLLGKFSLVVATSVSGATMAAIGALALLLSVGNFGQTLNSTFASDTGKAILPILVLIAAIVGLIVQEVDWKNVKSDPDVGASA